MSDAEDNYDETFTLNKWNAKLERYTRLAIFAPSNSGKSFFLRWLLYLNQDLFSAVIVICPSEDINPFYSKIIPNLFVFDELNEETLIKIDEIFQRQELAKKNLPEGVTEDDLSVLIIMDDCMAEEKKFLNHDIIKKLYKRGRHYKFTLWVVVQYFNDLASDLRGNVEYVVILKCDDEKMLEKYRVYLGGKEFGNKKKFAEVMDYYTKKYGCIVKDIKTGGSEFKDKFFWYKAQKTPDDWKMNPLQWEVAAEHYVDPDEVDGNEAESFMRDLDEDPVKLMEKMREKATAKIASTLKGAKKPVAKPVDKRKVAPKMVKLDEYGNEVD